jgi:hypothetical protein
MISLCRAWPGCPPNMRTSLWTGQTSSSTLRLVIRPPTAEDKSERYSSSFSSSLKLGRRLDFGPPLDSYLPLDRAFFCTQMLLLLSKLFFGFFGLHIQYINRVVHTAFILITFIHHSHTIEERKELLFSVAHKTLAIPPIIVVPA